MDTLQNSLFSLAPHENICELFHVEVEYYQWWRSKVRNNNVYDREAVNLVQYLPPTVTHLKLGKYFNHPLDSLHEGLTHLDLGDYFTQPGIPTQPILPGSVWIYVYSQLIAFPPLLSTWKQDSGSIIQLINFHQSSATYFLVDFSINPSNPSLPSQL